MHRISLSIALFAVILFAGCSAMPSTPTSTNSPIIVTTHLTLILTADPDMNAKTPPADSSNLDAAAMQMVDKAREHLMKKFNFSADQVTVFSVETVTWPDASLGCPQPDMSYAQVETPGYLILLEADGQTYNYHADSQETVVLCDVKSPGEIFLPPKP